MRGYTNAAGGGTLASIAFDRDAFIGYLVGLGSVVADVEEIDDFINSLAYSFASGSISADKFVTKGNNLMPRLDSFEKEAGRSILMYPQTGVTNAAINVVPSDGYYPAPYGTAVLKITTPNTTGPFGFYLNPYYADASRWIDLGKLDYWFSYYLYTTSPLSVTGSIKLISSFGDEVVVPFSITQSQGWVRFSDYFNLEANDSLSLYITINETDRNLYLDAIQVEPKYITTTEPSTFAPGGKVVIDGGNIRANSISAENAVFSTGAIIDADIANLNAAKIDAGIINTNVVTVGDYDRGLMTMYDNNISFYEPIDANTEKLRVSIGKLDTPGTTWGLKVLGTDGTSVLFNENGLTSLGTTEGLTKASYIDENLDIYGSKLRANSVDGAAKIVAQSITAGSIATNAIIARTIDANAITATKIAAETINASHLNSNIVTSKLIQLGETTVTAGIYGGGTTDSNIRFWAGDTFANREVAPFRITQDGKLYATGANIIAGYATNTELNNSINSVLADAQAYADILSEDLQSQLDGNITTWFYPVAPTLSNAPAIDWTTQELKNIHLGDLYYDTVTGYSYRFALISTVYQWIRITDVDVSMALSDAANAQDTADSKRRVFSTQPVPPYDIGDLWSQGPSGDLMICVVAKESGLYNSLDWSKAVKYTAIIEASSAPLNPAIGQQWLDTSLTPPMIKVWNGTAWVFTNYTAAEFEVEVGSISLAVAQSEITSSVTPILTSYETRISNAETKITPTAITNTVRTSTEYINDLGTKYNASSGSALEQTVSGLTLTVGDYENGILTGTKYTFDGTGATFTNGGLIIKNNLGVNVLSADVNGNLKITGDLTGSNGTFNGSIKIGSGTSIFKADTNGIYLGDETFTNADFRVSAAGAIRARSGSIGGFSVTSNSLTSGTVKLDSTNNRIYLNTSAYFDAGVSGSIIRASGDLTVTGTLKALNSVIGDITTTGYNLQGPNIGGMNYPVTMNGSNIITKSNFSLTGSTLTIVM